MSSSGAAPMDTSSSTHNTSGSTSTNTAPSSSSTTHPLPPSQPPAPIDHAALAAAQQAAHAQAQAAAAAAHAQAQAAALAEKKAAEAAAVQAAFEAAAAGPRTRSIVMDLGGDTIKVGWAGQQAPKIIPNCAVKNKRDTKWLVGDQMLPEVIANSSAPSSSKLPGSNVVHKITDYSGLFVRRAHERGFVVNWELENQVWGRALHKSILDPANTLSPSAINTLIEESSLLLTLPVCTPAVLAKDVDENVFEKWGFKKYRRMNTSSLAHRGQLAESYPHKSSSTPHTPSAVSASAASREPLHKLCALVVDSGYSFTHIMPVYQGKTITSAVKRINVGGKLLTNYLKETISFRAWNMMDETWIINDVKEKLCYVSTDFDRELQAAKKSRKVAEKIRREYVLPNGSTVLQGYVRDSDSVVHPDDQVLLMTNERFTVPEVLFTPLDIGLNQAGLVESIVAAVEATPTWMHGLFYDNIILVGGNAKLPNFQTRIERELRPLVPTEYRIQCRMGKDPITTAWSGGSILAHEAHTNPGGSALDYITKVDYDEYGSEALTRRWEGDEDEKEESAPMEL